MQLEIIGMHKSIAIIVYLYMYMYV